MQLYLREGCHLCEEMQRAIAVSRVAVDIQIIDVDSAPALARRYGSQIPVLADGETVVCSYFLDLPALQRTLAMVPSAVPPERQ